ncbi:MAG: ABC transporter permease [Chloroflexi bacterium]|nr:ABC transporter permease [Chloroflexota bacterium]
MIRRLLLAVLVLFLVSLGTFTLIRLVPGDVIDAMAAQQTTITGDAAAKIRHDIGLDRPFYRQYLTWMKGLFTGNWGSSIFIGTPVRTNISKALPVSLEIGILALILAICIGIPIGVLSALRQDKPVDYAGRLIAIGGISMPDFWIGTMFILYSSLWWHYQPPLGWSGFIDEPWNNFQRVIFPALILGFRLSASSMRMTRSTMLEVLRQDYIRTAWSKGLRERVVIYRHALKNAMIPVVTIIGSQTALIIGGTVIIETLFTLPGMGLLTLNAIRQRDYPQVQGNVVVLSTFIVLMNLLVDISYAWLDPRIRYR